MTKAKLDAQQKLYQQQLVVARQVAASHQVQLDDARQQVQQLEGALADVAFWLSELAKPDV